VTAGPRAEPPRECLEQRIAIASDGSITARSGKVEYGQNIRIGFARIVAEELRVPIERVRVELGETDTVPWDMGTFGSMSTAVDGARLRNAAVFARAVLLARASTRLGAGLSELGLRDGVIRAPDGRACTFAELVTDAPLAGEIPELAQAGDAGSGVGPVQAPDHPLRLEALEIVTGRRRYPADVRLPGMLRGRVVHGPRFDSQLLACDERGAREMPGVVAVVREGNLIGVIAERDAQARAAADAIHASWAAIEQPAAQPIELSLRHNGDVEGAFAAAARTLEASYHIPHIAHAALAPSAAVADVRDDGVDLYVATQRPFGLKDEVSRALGVAPGAVHVHPQGMGGMFGRGGMNDAALEAALLSRAVRRPVLVQWSRPEEFRLSPARPVLDATIRAGIDATGRIIGWRSVSRTNPFTYGAAADRRVLELTSGRNAVPAYAIDAMEVQLEVRPGEVRTGALRSLAAAPNVFAIESFMDELAELSGQDPLAFRLRHIADPRLERVLELVRERSAWDARGRDGRALGVACAIYHGTYVAQVAHVRAEPDGALRIEQVWCAVDAGRLVHPDGARNQIEGGIQHGASCALLEELHIVDGEIRTATWHDYAIARCSDAPAAIDVTFVSDSAVPSSGVGEPGFVPIAAALANAIYAATKVRLRQLPLDKRR
jgi:CO/xanthine dehydrogenase Mo-binding subunit